MAYSEIAFVRGCDDSRGPRLVEVAWKVRDHQPWYAGLLGE